MMYSNYLTRFVLAFGFCVSLAAALSLALPHDARASENAPKKNRSGGGSNFGIGISIDIGKIIQQSQQNKKKPPPRVVNRPRGCPKPLVYSKRSKRCYCPSSKGYVTHKGKCVPKPTPQLVTKLPPNDIPHIQECLLKVGFNPGPVDGKAGRKTSQAFRSFQEANALSDQSNDLTDQPSLDKLFEICDVPDYGLVKALYTLSTPNQSGGDAGKPVEGATVTSLY